MVKCVNAVKCVKAVNNACEKMIMVPHWNKIILNAINPIKLKARAIKDLHSE